MSLLFSQIGFRQLFSECKQFLCTFVVCIDPFADAQDKADSQEQ